MQTLKSDRREELAQRMDRMAAGARHEAASPFVTAEGREYHLANAQLFEARAAMFRQQAAG